MIKIQEKSKSRNFMLSIMNLVMIAIIMLILSPFTSDFTTEIVVDMNYKTVKTPDTENLRSIITLSESDFEHALMAFFPYSMGEHDCKFYAYWWKEYLDYHGIDYTYVTTHNHIYVVGYTDDGYTIYDGKVIIRKALLN